MLRRAQHDARLHDETGEGIADLLRAAGFTAVGETARHTRFLGSISAYRATR